MSRQHDQIDFSNAWTFSRMLDVPAKDSGSIAIAIGDPGNELVALWFRARARGLGLDSGILKLIEDRTVTNTSDPEQGWNRNRAKGDEQVPNLPGLVNDDRFLFYTTFNAASNGKELIRSAIPCAGEGDTGLFKLSAGPKGHRFYVLEVENVNDQNNPANAHFVVEIEYGFIGKV